MRNTEKSKKKKKKKNIQQWTTKSKSNVMDNAEEPSLNRLQNIQKKGMQA